MGQFNGLITQDDINQLSKSDNLSFDRDRITILQSMQSMDVQACPGSGKTTLIAAKLILLAKKWQFSGQGICVLSHTNIAKDEIIERLKQSKTPEAQRLLSYPHFIGTFQDFMGKFLTFPYLRSKNIAINCVDTDICAGLIKAKISYRTNEYITKKSKRSNLLNNFALRFHDGKLSFDVPAFSKPSSSESYKDLEKVREQLINDGYLFYNDVYTYAECALSKNNKLAQQVQKRFPCVFIDEMQDTQKFQDDLLREIFPLDSTNLIVHRFGDPDQAIFRGNTNEAPNDSFNGKKASEMTFVIDKSHRFDEKLARKIKPLSINQIELASEISEDEQTKRLKLCSKPSGFEHSFIIYDDTNINQVINTFAQIVSEQFNAEYKTSERFSVKVLGAVGNEVDPNQQQLKIGSYWQFYDKNKTIKNLNTDNLIDVIRQIRYQMSQDFSEYYRILIDSIIKWLSLAKKIDLNNKRFTPKSLQEFLKQENNWNIFRKILYDLLNDANFTTKEGWEKVSKRLKNVFAFTTLPTDAERFISYSEDVAIHDSQTNEFKGITPIPDNIIRHSDGFDIYLSTIHGVKGETHDATLVLETKNRDYDIGKLIDHLSGNERLKIDSTKIILSQFARQLYVATSRPKHLLCIAMHKNRITHDQIEKLNSLEWKIISLSNT